MYKKISMLLCGLILALNAHAIVQSDIFTGGISYRIIDKSNAYVEAIDCHGKEIVVPASFTMNGVTYSVKSIATGAFWFSNMQSVSIEDGIDVILDSAFYKCDKLEEVSLPSTGFG